PRARVPGGRSTRMLLSRRKLRAATDIEAQARRASRTRGGRGRGRDPHTGCHAREPLRGLQTVLWMGLWRSGGKRRRRCEKAVERSVDNLRDIVGNNPLTWGFCFHMLCVERCLECRLRVVGFRMLHVERPLDNHPENTVAAHPRRGAPLPRTRTTSP